MKNILKKLHTIQTEIVKMEKDGYNDFQRYNYLSETQITLRMKQLFDKHGVVFAHSSKIDSVIPFNNAKGAQNFLTNVIIDYTFYDIETGEKLEGKASGQGTDGGDKGIYKAITGAIKYIFMKNFLIPTGDDPENEKPQKQAPQPQYQNLPY
jgi:hypothetical protein